MRAGFWEILLIVVLILILFGHAKIPDLMRNLANGLKTFKKELKTESKEENEKNTISVPVKAVGPAKKKVATKKPVVKKTAVKKTTTKKPTVKKSTAKKK